MISEDEMPNTGRDTIAETTVPDLGVPYEACLTEGTPEPCMIVIFGASGDLTARKIVPALFHLYLNNGLPDSFVVVGCARTKLSDQEFRDKMEKALPTAGTLDVSKWNSFAQLLHYQPIDYKESSSFSVLAGSLRKLDKKYGTKGNKIFYLAIPPSLYKSTAQMLGMAGLSIDRKSVV